MCKALFLSLHTGEQCQSVGSHTHLCMFCIFQFSESPHHIMVKP